MLEIDVSLSRGDFDLEVTFAAPTPGVTALFGRSGSGKTTVINLIAGLLRPDRGRIALDDAVLHDTSRSYSLPPQRRAIGYVFQDPLLFPHFDVAGNLRYGQRRAQLRHHRDSTHVALGGDPALLEEYDVAREPDDFLEFMAHIDDRDRVPVAQGLEPGQQLSAPCRVKRGQGFVEQQKPRPRQQRAPERHPLALSAR